MLLLPNTHCLVTASVSQWTNPNLRDLNCTYNCLSKAFGLLEISFYWEEWADDYDYIYFIRFIKVLSLLGQRQDGHGE